MILFGSSGIVRCARSPIALVTLPPSLDRDPDADGTFDEPGDNPAETRPVEQTRRGKIQKVSHRFGRVLGIQLELDDAALRIQRYALL